MTVSEPQYSFLSGDKEGLHKFKCLRMHVSGSRAFGRLLDHARLRKTDVHYDLSRRELVIHLRRHRRSLLLIGRFVWLNIIPPTKRCALVIRDVESCEIRDEDPENPKRNEVTIGPLHWNGNNEFYIESFCDQENPYGIHVKVSSINVALYEHGTT